MISKILNLARRYKRKFYIRYYGFKHVHPKFLATGGIGGVSKDLRAGAYSYIGPGCKIYPKVEIGNFTMLANDVYIVGGDHNFRNPDMPTVFAGRDEVRPTRIGSDVWIGARVTIMTGVTIGDGAIIATGAVVTTDVEPYAIYGGVPAKKIKERFTAEERQTHEKMLRSMTPDTTDYDHLLSSGREFYKANREE